MSRTPLLCEEGNVLPRKLCPKKLKVAALSHGITTRHKFLVPCGSFLCFLCTFPDLLHFGRYAVRATSEIGAGATVARISACTWRSTVGFDEPRPSSPQTTVT